MKRRTLFALLVPIGTASALFSHRESRNRLQKQQVSLRSRKLRLSGARS
jgi:hypothetical protein